MRLRTPLSPHFFRHVVAVAALLAQLFAATGAPLPSQLSSARHKNADAPFPCQNHPCGCQTSEQGWAGDCCCFTLEEKLAWADARGIEPPSHVRPTVAARTIARTDNKSCCAKKTEPSCCDRADDPDQTRVEKSAVRWVVGVFAQKCKGEGFAGLLKLELVVVPTSPFTLPAADPGDSVPDLNPRVFFTSHSPPTPPPRSA